MYLASGLAEQRTSHQHIRRLAAAVTIPAAFVGSALLGSPAALADVPAAPGSLTVHYSDGALDWTVPVGVYEVSLTAVGGSGAEGAHSRGSTDTGHVAGTGGNGAVVTARIPVVPGEHLQAQPGSAAHGQNGGLSTGSLAPGGSAEAGSAGGVGGGGGAATVVGSGSVVLAAAGGGGGGGGAGAGTDAGNGGHAGSPGAPGQGDRWGTALGGSGVDTTAARPLGAGGDGRFTPQPFPLDLPGGGGGGGGGGLDGTTTGGGRGGESGPVFGGGGGGAGGLSFAVDPSTTIGVASAPGDGWVRLDWTPGVTLTSGISAPSSVAQGAPVVLTDSLTPPRDGLTAPTGSVDFEQYDATTQTWTRLGPADVGNGGATLTTPLAGVGSQAVRARYGGDSTYFPSTSDVVFVNVIPNATTLSAGPSAVDFGSVVVGTSVTRTVTVTNTGGYDWIYTGAGSDNPAVGLTAQSCATLHPGDHCTATVAFAPAAAGPLSATLTLSGNYGSVALPLTGTADPAVTTTSITPNPLAFGNVATGTTAKKTLTITNTGNVPWSFSGASSDNPAVSLATPPCATLSAGAQCTATLAFAPTAAGAVAATLTLTGTFGSTTVPVTGTGVVAKPVVTGVSPNAGPVRGGTRVTITGRDLTGVTSIKVGPVSLTSVVCPTSTTCTAVTPRARRGTYDVRITTAGGTSDAVRADRFTYR